MTPEPADRFCVVSNAEGQHAIWPAAKAPPLGWIPTRWSGTKSECLARVAMIWTDIRPKPSSET